MTNPDKRAIIIVYASQTGQSKTIAELISDMLTKTETYKPELHCISRHDKDFKLNELTAPLVFVGSTTGDGEVPETALKCYNKLKRLNTDENRNYLQNLNYALLGLGDTNYAQFCNGPKIFHKRLSELGAKCFYGPFWADDGVGLDETVEPFKDGLIKALDGFFSQPATSTNENLDHNPNDLNLKMNTLSVSDTTLASSDLNLPDLPDQHLQVDISDVELEEPLSETDLLKMIAHLYPQASIGIFKSSVTSNSLMTQSGSVKDCFDLKFKLESRYLPESGEFTSELDFTYEPGQAVDVICPNSSQEIDDLFARLKITDQARRRIQISTNDESKKTGQVYLKLARNSAISLHSFFKYCVDIRHNALKKNFLRMLGEYCAKDDEKARLFQLASREGSDHYMNQVKENQLSLLDILNVFKSCQPPLGHLIQMLPQLNTRPYSLCTSAQQLPHMEVVFNVVKFEIGTTNRTYERLGVGTGYLASLKSDETVYFLKRKFHMFTFPPCDECDKPIVMIGPGTGIAPFVSYLRHLEASQSEKKPKLWLFYGCRDPTKDFLFKSDIQRLASSFLEKFSISFSRFTHDKTTGSIPNVELTDFIERHHIQNSKYVQDSILRYAKEIAEFMCEQNGYLYVCGDAKNMSKDVLSCLSECLRTQRGMSEEEAAKFLNEMIKTKRYKQDIWA
jgi:methionine synthase reductase